MVMENISGCFSDCTYSALGQLLFSREDSAAATGAAHSRASLDRGRVGVVERSRGGNLLLTVDKSQATLTGRFTDCAIRCLRAESFKPE